MSEYFKKIYIMTEDDLPKEEGWYYAHDPQRFLKLQSLFFKPDDPIYTKNWMNDYKPEWYLFPIEQKLDVPTEEEIKNIDWIAIGEPGWHSKKDNELYEMGFKRGAKWMRNTIIKKNQ